VIVSIILVAEGDLSIVHVHQSRIRDRDAVRVPADVVEDLLRTGEGRFRVDDPLGLSRRRVYRPTSFGQRVECNQAAGLTANA
jgi:hypothetical protein